MPSEPVDLVDFVPSITVSGHVGGERKRLFIERPYSTVCSGVKSARDKTQHTRLGTAQPIKWLHLWKLETFSFCSKSTNVFYYDRQSSMLRVFS